MKVKNALLLFAVVFLSHGCNRYSAPLYQVSDRNRAELKYYQGREVVVGKFIHTKKKKKKNILCRSVTFIDIGDEKTFAEYVQTALVKEFKKAGLYSESSNTVITGVIDSIDYTSLDEDYGDILNYSYWEIALTLNSSNGHQVKVVDQYRQNTNWDSKTACRQGAKSFLPAVQKLLNKAFRNSEFALLLEPKK